MWPREPNSEEAAPSSVETAPLWLKPLRVGRSHLVFGRRHPEFIGLARNIGLLRLGAWGHNFRKQVGATWVGATATTVRRLPCGLRNHTCSRSRAPRCGDPPAVPGSPCSSREEREPSGLWSFFSLLASRCCSGCSRRPACLLLHVLSPLSVFIHGNAVALVAASTPRSRGLAHGRRGLSSGGFPCHQMFSHAWVCSTWACRPCCSNARHHLSPIQVHTSLPTVSPRRHRHWRFGEGRSPGDRRVGRFCI